MPKTATPSTESAKPPKIAVFRRFRPARDRTNPIRPREWTSRNPTAIARSRHDQIPDAIAVTDRENTKNTKNQPMSDGFSLHGRALSRRKLNFVIAEGSGSGSIVRLFHLRGFFAVKIHTNYWFGSRRRPRELVRVFHTTLVFKSAS